MTTARTAGMEHAMTIFCEHETPWNKVPHAACTKSMGPGHTCPRRAKHETRARQKVPNVQSHETDNLDFTMNASHSDTHY